MANRKTGLGRKQNPAERSPNDTNIELSEEELSRVSGGKPGSGGSTKLFEACATGQHIKDAKIT
jgi:bacteriocin-like protein